MVTTFSNYTNVTFFVSCVLFLYILGMCMYLMQIVNVYVPYTDS